MDSPWRKPDLPLIGRLSATLDFGDNRRLAYVHHPGKTPGVLFCGGFRSDMTGTKALALERFCAQERRSFTRFDYSGHGRSSGRFEDGTIGGWTDDAIAIADRVAKEPVVVVGSSMGGWIMLLLALARPKRVRGLVGIASAPDFTQDLMWTRATAAERTELETRGRWVRPSDYGDEPYVITRQLIEDGRRRLLLRAPIDVTCPVHLLHGQRDPDVPWETSLRLAKRLRSDDVTVELIKAGDHRLSSPAAIERICAAVRHIVGMIGKPG